MKTSVLLSLLLFATIAQGAFDASYYPNNLTLLEDRYTLFWKVEGDSMRIGLKVKTTGWIGFGIAEPTSGSMHGSDILVAIVKDGKTELRDMFALVRDYPTMDDCQSWELISGEEANGITTVEARRLLNTTDAQDRPFTASARIVVAFGTSDTFAKHADDSRKPYAIQFWGNNQVILPNSPSRTYINTNYTVPSVRTTYAEVMFDSLFTEDASAVAIEHVVTTKYVHHFLVFGCKTEYNETLGLDANWELLWAWAPGMDALIVPATLGFTFGPSNYRSVRLQIHYDNPSNDVGQLDNSGVRLYYETTLRPIEAGVLWLGDGAVSNFRNPIKAGTGTIEYEYDCPAACTNQWNRTLHVWGNFLHMHQIGTQMWGKQWRNGQLVRETNRIDFWDFGLQQMTPKEHTIEPGDRISTHCVYQQQSVDVPFGEASNDEMCIQFVYYYPKVTKGFGLCGYLSDPGLPVDNATFCDDFNDPVLDNTGNFVSNPTEKDPVGGNIVAFGKSNSQSFVCLKPSETKDTQATLPTESGKDIDENSSHSLAVTMVLMMIVALLL